MSRRRRPWKRPKALPKGEIWPPDLSTDSTKWSPSSNEDVREGSLLAKVKARRMELKDLGFTGILSFIVDLPVVFGIGG